MTPESLHVPRVLMLAVDPGLRGCGMALGVGHATPVGRWVLDEFLWAGFAVSTCKDKRGPPAWAAMSFAAVLAGAQRAVTAAGALPIHVVIERPQIYQGGLQKADPDDLMELMGVVGYLTADFMGDRYGFNVHAVRPKEWKGNMDKKVHQTRLKQGFPKAWLPRMQSKNNHVWDAVGMLMHGGGVFAGGMRVEE